jgi:hypothetical protein
MHGLDLLLELGLPRGPRPLQIAKAVVESVERLANRPDDLLGGRDTRVGDSKDLLARLSDSLRRSARSSWRSSWRERSATMIPVMRPSPKPISSVTRAMTKVVASMRRTMTVTSDKIGGVDLPRWFAPCKRQ